MESRVYRPDERPDVLVTIEGVEYRGELRAWQHREDGSWWADVSWRPRPGETYIDTFSAEGVRLDETEPRPAPDRMP